MRLTERRIKKIISEEVENLLTEWCFNTLDEDPFVSCIRPPASHVTDSATWTVFPVQEVPNDLRTVNSKHAIRKFFNPSYMLGPENPLAPRPAIQGTWNEFWLANQLLEHCVGWASCADMPPRTVPEIDDDARDIPIPEGVERKMISRILEQIDTDEDDDDYDDGGGWDYEDYDEGGDDEGDAAGDDTDAGTDIDSDSSSDTDTDTSPVLDTDTDSSEWTNTAIDRYDADFEHEEDYDIYFELTKSDRNGHPYAEWIDINLPRARDLAIRLGTKQRKIIRDPEMKYFYVYECKKVPFGRYMLGDLDPYGDTMQACTYAGKTQDPRGANGQRKKFRS